MWRAEFVWRPLAQQRPALIRQGSAGECILLALSRIRAGHAVKRAGTPADSDTGVKMYLPPSALTELSGNPAVKFPMTFGALFIMR